MELPPLWSLGFQQCRYSYYPDYEVLNAARTFREKNIPADVIYLDIHYMDAYKVFTWHDKRFPNPKKLTDELRELNFDLAVIIDPGVKREEGYAAYEEGVEKDLFVKYPDGVHYSGQVWPGWSCFPDFTDEKTRTWWGQKLNVLTDNGVTGFWNDMNEPAAWGQHLPDLIEFEYEGEGATHKKARNVYGMQMARSTYEGAKKLYDLVLKSEIGVYTIDCMLIDFMLENAFKWIVWNGHKFLKTNHQMTKGWKAKSHGLVYQDESFGSDIITDLHK
jgi:alpha-glucosidase